MDEDALWLIHLSDFHFRTNVEYVRCQALLSGISDALDAFQCPEERVVVVVSGDLTDNGVGPEFTIAYKFLKSKLTEWGGDDLDPVGIDVAAEWLHTVAGNHDHWNGLGFQVSNSFNPNVYPDYFLPVPWCKRILSPDAQLELQIYGLDSNSGLVRGSNHKAQGAYHDADISKLVALLAANAVAPESSSARRVRILVSHHSMYPYLTVLDARPLTAESREAILDCAARHYIDIVLSGHTHKLKEISADRPLPFQRSLTAKPCVIHEFRSASTLSGPVVEQKQGFWMHKISYGQDAPQLSSWRFDLDRTKWLSTKRISTDSPDFKRILRIVDGRK